MFVSSKYKLIIIPSYRTPDNILKLAFNYFNEDHLVIKERDKKGADPFATENVAQEIIDAKIAREHLNELKNLINLRFGPNTWQEILTERKRRIDEAKERKRKIIAERNRKKQEIMDILTYFTIGLGVCLIVGLLIYMFVIIL